MSFSFYVNSKDGLWRNVISVGSKETYDTGPKIPGVWIEQSAIGIHIATDRNSREGGKL